MSRHLQSILKSHHLEYSIPRFVLSFVICLWSFVFHRVTSLSFCSLLGSVSVAFEAEHHRPIVVSSVTPPTPYSQQIVAVDGADYTQARDEYIA